MQLARPQLNMLVTGQKYSFRGPTTNLLTSLPPFREGVAYTKRTPNCQKCGQHGRKSRLKGHKRVCPFKDCNCIKCQVVSERQRLMANQIKIRRRQRKDTIINLTRHQLAETINVAGMAPNPPLPYLGLLYKQLCDQTSQSNKNIMDLQPDSSGSVLSSKIIDDIINKNDDVILQSEVDLNRCSSMPHSSQPTGIISTNNQESSVSSFNVTTPLIMDENLPQISGSPLSTVGTEMSMSPQIHPRTQSFDLGLLSSGAVGPTNFGNCHLLTKINALNTSLPSGKPALSSTTVADNLSLGAIIPQVVNLSTPSAFESHPPVPTMSDLTQKMDINAIVELNQRNQLYKLLELLYQQAVTQQSLQQSLLQQQMQPQLLPKTLNAPLLQSISLPQTITTTFPTAQPNVQNLLLALSGIMQQAELTSVTNMGAAPAASKTIGFADVCSV